MMNKHPDTLDYQERRRRVPLWWHFVYGPRVAWNWLMLLIGVTVLIVLGSVTMAALFGIAG